MEISTTLQDVQLSDEQLSLIRNELKGLLRLKDYSFTNINYLPLSKKYSVQVEIKMDGTTYIRHACRKNITDVADDLNAQYAQMVFIIGGGKVAKKAVDIFVANAKRYFLD